MKMTNSKKAPESGLNLTKQRLILVQMKGFAPLDVQHFACPAQDDILLI